MILIHSQGWEPGIYKSYQKKIRGTFSVLPSLSPAQSPAPQVSTGTFPEGALPIQDSPVVLQPKKHLSLPHFFTFYCLSTASFLSNLQFLGPVHNKHFLWQTVSSNSTKCSPLSPTLSWSLFSMYDITVHIPSCCSDLVTCWSHPLVLCHV